MSSVTQDIKLGRSSWAVIREEAERHPGSNVTPYLAGRYAPASLEPRPSGSAPLDDGAAISSSRLRRRHAEQMSLFQPAIDLHKNLIQMPGSQRRLRAAMVP